MSLMFKINIDLKYLNINYAVKLAVMSWLQSKKIPDFLDMVDMPLDKG